MPDGFCVTTVGGHIGHDLELTQSDKGGTMLEFDLSYTKRWRGGKTLVWLPVRTYGKAAEFAVENFTKGAFVIGHGEMISEKDEDGKRVVLFSASKLQPVIPGGGVDKENPIVDLGGAPS